MNNSVTFGNARFTAITDGLVRMEYSADGKFEDRPTIRIPKRPDGICFENITEKDNKITLQIGLMAIDFVNNNYAFSAENLRIFDNSSGKLIWQPGQKDFENLGGAPMSMDNVSRSIIPEGVHPASDENFDSDNYNLWNFCANKANNDFAVCELHSPEGEDLGLEQYLKMVDIEKMPENFRELIAVRSKYPPGLLSKNGYFLFNDSETPVVDDDGWFDLNRKEDYQDYYFFNYGKNYKKALKDYIYLFGSSPMLPKYTLGMCFTKYPFPSEKEFKSMVETFEKEQMPLDMICLDLPYHKYDWLGFDWNTDCVNPKTYFPFCKEHGLHNVANIHPFALAIDDSHFKDFLQKADIKVCEGDILPPSQSDASCRFNKYNLTEKKTAHAFWDANLKPLMSDGVDYFWYDGMPALGGRKKWPQFLSNYIYRNLEIRENPDRRQLLMSRLGGIGAHRFPIHFTADAFSHWEVLKSQVEYTLRAGHSGFSLISHDIAGIQNYQYPFHFLDSELYCRWVQWGALSPVFRLHSSHDGIRLPWLYGDRVMKFYKKALKLRRELLPYFYTLMYETVKTGLPMTRSCALSLPDWEKGYGVWDSYFLGEKLFVTPFLEAGGCRKVVLPEGEWYCPLTKETITSDGNYEFVLASVEPNATPHFIPTGSVIVKREDDGKNAMAELEYVLEVYPSSNKETTHSDVVNVYEDDGITLGYEKGEFRLLKIDFSQKNNVITLNKTVEDGVDKNFLSKPYGKVKLFGNYETNPTVVLGDLKSVMEKQDDNCYIAKLDDFFGSGNKEIKIVF